MEYDDISIKGSKKFETHTVDALELIKKKSKRDYNKIKKYLKSIKQAKVSGMDLIKARFNVSIISAYHSTEWYASIIVHDVHHYYLHNIKNFKWERKNFLKHEHLCFDEQLRFLKKIKVSEYMIKHVEKCYTKGHWRLSYQKRHKDW